MNALKKDFLAFTIIALLLCLSSGSLHAQQIHVQSVGGGSSIEQTAINTTFTHSTTWNIDNTYSIGRNDADTLQNTWRTPLGFSLNGIPTTAKINNVTVTVSIGGWQNSSYSASIVKLPNSVPANSTGWGYFDKSNTTYWSSLSYSGVYNQITNAQLIADVQSALSSHTITLGAMSNNEGNNLSYAWVIITMDIYYTLQAKVIVQNSIGASPSTDTVDGQKYTSPHTFTWDSLSSHTLYAYDQTINGYIYPFLGKWTVTNSADTIRQNPVHVSALTSTYTAYFGPGYVSTTIDQKLFTTVSADSIGVWENGTHFTEYHAPVTKTFSASSNPNTLSGTQKIVSGQKYNYWTTGGQNTIVTDVTNPHSFTIQTNSSPLISQLNQTVDGTSFQVNLEATTNYSDSVRFQDPWLIDSSGTYGLQNRGMSAPFKLVATGGNPIGTGTNYKGVITGQDPSRNAPAYYSVQVPSTKALGGYSSYFYNWTSNANASVSNPTNTTSPVVFTNSSAAVTANYKGVHISNNASAFSNNSQRKLVRTYNGWLHQVYESMGHVWYEMSTDGGTTWTLQGLIPGGSPGPLDIGGGKCPSIDYGHNYD